MYSSMADMAQDRDLTVRCMAAAAKEIVANPGIATSVTMQGWLKAGGITWPMWYITARPDWQAAWDSAAASRAANPPAEGDPAPTPIGQDASVITDAMIQAAIVAVAGM